MRRECQARAPSARCSSAVYGRVKVCVMAVEMVSEEAMEPRMANQHRSFNHTGSAGKNELFFHKVGSALKHQQQLMVRLADTRIYSPTEMTLEFSTPFHMVHPLVCAV